MDGYDTYRELRRTLRRSGRDRETIGYAPGGRPLLAVAAGGTATPAAVVLAGAHADEHAGPTAATALAAELETDRRVWIVPTRDPVGLDGYAAAAALGLGERPALDTHADVVSLLERAGEVLYREDDGAVAIGLLGDYGFATARHDAGVFLLQRLKALATADPAVLEPLHGRRVFTTVPDPTVPGARGLERAYTTVIRPDGRPLHLNRFFEDAWAPAESRAVRRLLDGVRPGLTIDCHETGAVEDRAYVVCRPFEDRDRHRREREIGRAMAAAMADAGTSLADDADVLDGPTVDVAHDADPPAEPFYSRAGPGAYWMDFGRTSPARGGEGPNAGDYAARHHGLAFDVETGMHAPLGDRVAAQRAAVQTAIDRWETATEQDRAG